MPHYQTQGVLSIKEQEQFKCPHVLERLNPHERMPDNSELGFRWRCVKCGKLMHRKNGVVISNEVKSIY